jgi:hypothetical protein
MNRLLICAALLLIPAISCRKDKSGVSDQYDLVRSAVSRVPGWVEQKDRYCSFKPEELYGIIDGGATEYIQHGLKSGIGIVCTSGTKSLGMYCEDFGYASKARAMVGVKKASLSEPKAIPNVAVSSAMYGEVLGGCVAYWAKDRYYIEMTLTGYDSLGIAVRDAGTLIDSLSPVIGK